MKGRLLLFTGAAAVMLLAACGDDSGSSSNTTSAPAASGGGSATTAAAGDAAGAGTVVAKDIAYNPDKITVKVGDTVTFKNEDSFAHTFTADNGEFDSNNVDGGGSFQFRRQGRHHRLPLQDPLEHARDDHSRVLSSLFTTFPRAFRGRASRNRTWRGRLYLASRAATTRCSSASSTARRRHDIGDDGLAPLV